MEKTVSKKLFAGVCALSAAFILAACNPISAVPSNYEDPIVLNGDTTAVDDDSNKLGKIYDAIASDRNTKIVSDLLEKVADMKFGSYAKIKEAGESTDDSDSGVKMTYINDHADVFKRADDDKTELHAGKTAKEVQLNRLDIFWKDIQSRVSEFFWNEVTSGSYNDEEGRFDEGKLWMAHYYEFYDLGKKDDAMGNQFFVTGEHNKENIMSYLLGDYSNNGDATKHGYIEEKILPSILKDKLVEEYVYNNNFDSLGRAYARKVNYIKVSYENYLMPWKMLKAYADKYIVGPDGAAVTEAPDFEIIVKALKGYDSVGKFKNATDDGIKPLATDSVAYKLIAGAIDGDISDDKYGVTVPAGGYTYNDVTLIPEGRYFKDTKLGALIYSYQKAIKAEEAGRFPLESDKRELDKFTGSGKPKEYGLREKLISLAKEDYTTDGWFVKNGGLGELPSALRDRLFNINVANKLDNGELVLEHPATTVGGEDGTMGAYEDGSSKRVPYMRNINGFKYVIPEKSQPYADNHYNYIYHDVDAKAYYIVQVLEAPSTPKLNIESKDSYIKQAGTLAEPYKTEEIARAVAKVLGTKDSYIKDAYTEILKLYTFEFYETSLYEHFKSEYPDIFDDED